MSETDSEAHRTDPLATFSQRRRRGVLVTTAAVAALGLSLGGAAVAGAATAPAAPTGSHPPAGGSPPAAVGTVATVGDGTFTLTTQDKKTITVDVGSSTTYDDRGVTSPTIANVTTGEHVAVFGTDSSDVVTATRVAIGEPPGGKGPGGRADRGKGGGPPAGSGSSSSTPG